jgi:hypothetical protein
MTQRLLATRLITWTKLDHGSNYNPFTLKYVVNDGVFKIYYNGVLNQTISGITRSNLFFKAGDYCNIDGDAETDYC